MKTRCFLLIQADHSRIFGAGTSPEAARDDALNYAPSTVDTECIYAEVDAFTIDEIDADTPFTELSTPEA